MQEIRMQLTSYTAVIDRWKMALALKRIVSMGFPQQQWGELLQELAVEIWLFNYEPGRGNRASESTALFALITNHLMSARRARCRAQGTVRSLECVLAEQDKELDPDPALQYEDEDPACWEVREAVASLPSHERAVCEGIMHEETIHEIALRLRCSWHTVKRTIERVRRRFDSMGLGAHFATGGNGSETGQEK